VIDRSTERRRIEKLLVDFRVVAIVGARQVGKTTLARAIGRRGKATYFDLESPRDLAKLADPTLLLERLRGLVILDEIQRRPELFPVLRVLADKPRGPRFLVLGSASPELLRQSSESLAGRIAYHELGPISLAEVGARHARRLWLRGGFPRAYIARTDAVSFTWREKFVQTFVERDAPQLGIGIPAPTLRRFWGMLAHVHAQTLNYSELARSMGVSDMTIRHYTEALAHTFMVRLLPPWHENLAKRQVKARKLFITDSGILHALLDIPTNDQLDVHPKAGASWEGFCIEAIIRSLDVPRDRCFFWATHQNAELDLLVVRGNKRRGFEIKLTAAPTVTPSMRIALQDLRLDSIDVIHAGAETFPLAPKIRAVALRDLTTRH
jgi:predicted AAA+ superfamily ATPase